MSDARMALMLEMLDATEPHCIQCDTPALTECRCENRCATHKTLTCYLCVDGERA